MNPRQSSQSPDDFAGLRSFLNDIEVTFGPAGLIGRVFLAADAAARERGVFLSFAPMQELVALNQANRDSWRPLLPIFDPECGRFDASCAFCILGRTARGEVVLTQAARFFDWQGTSFHEEATSLRLFYHDPARWRREGEAAEVSAPSARLIRGKVAFTGAHWCRTDYRGKGLPAITPRIARALAFTRWDVAYTCTIMAQDVYSRGVAQRAGYPYVEWGVHLKNNPVGTLMTALLWSDRASILADLDDFLRRSVRARSESIERDAQQAQGATRRRAR
jgi:hypothetical protein